MALRQVYLGIDPGLDGALAVISAKGKFVDAWDAPTTTVKRGRKNKRVYMPASMVSLVRYLATTYDIAAVGFEFVHAMPGQGVSSMFSMGQGVGIWEGIIAALGLPLEYVTPQQWKKLLMRAGTGDDKQASIVRAMALFPSAADWLKRKKDDGRADAMLIAEYTRRLHESGHRK